MLWCAVGRRVGRSVGLFGLGRGTVADHVPVGIARGRDRGRQPTMLGSSGEYATSSFGYTYNDVETPMGKLTGEVDVLHVNHHGSSHSSNKVGCA